MWMLHFRSFEIWSPVEGLVPALQTDSFFKLARPKRNTKAKHFEDYITSNIVEKRSCNNTKGLELPDYKKQQYQHSFFVDTVIHWNHLPNRVMHANSLEAFKTALRNQRQ
jgi:hypothetical protein